MTLRDQMLEWRERALEAEGEVEQLRALVKSRSAVPFQTWPKRDVEEFKCYVCGWPFTTAGALAWHRHFRRNDPAHIDGSEHSALAPSEVSSEGCTGQEHPSHIDGDALALEHDMHGPDYAVEGCPTCWESTHIDGDARC